MGAAKEGRHRGETRPSSLRVRGVGGVALLPEGANDFRRKCSEYTEPSRWLVYRPVPASIDGGLS